MNHLRYRRIRSECIFEMCIKFTVLWCRVQCCTNQGDIWCEIVKVRSGHPWALITLTCTSCHSYCEINWRYVRKLNFILYSCFFANYREKFGALKSIYVPSTFTLVSKSCLPVGWETPNLSAFSDSTFCNGAILTGAKKMLHELPLFNDFLKILTSRYKLYLQKCNR